MQILIQGTTEEAVAEIRRSYKEYGNLKHVTVYFEKNNFILKPYKLLSNSVHMVLECENAEVQVEAANCGYTGAGPMATIDILSILGMDEQEMDILVRANNALDFSVYDHKILCIDTAELFTSRSNPLSDFEYPGIQLGRNHNMHVELLSKKITFYNPHRHDFIGFIRLLGCMKSRNFSYYIGPESPLEDGIYIPKEVLEDCLSDTDTKGIEHVNLTISSEDVQVVCFIDRNEERYIIDTIYFCLTKKHLKYMEEEKCSTLSDWIRRFRDRYKVLSDSIDLPDPEDK